MTSNVLGDERAPRNETEPAAPDIDERARDQTRSEPAPFQSRRNLRMHEHNRAGLDPVPELAHPIAVEEKLVPELGGVVADIHLPGADHNLTVAPWNLATTEVAATSKSTRGAPRT
jgi:hypothetical protein